jgi:hypothetical protein
MIHHPLSMAPRDQLRSTTRTTYVPFYFLFLFLRRFHVLRCEIVLWHRSSNQFFKILSRILFFHEHDNRQLSDIHEAFLQLKLSLSLSVLRVLILLLFILLPNYTTKTSIHQEKELKNRGTLAHAIVWCTPVRPTADGRRPVSAYVVLVGGSWRP